MAKRTERRVEPLYRKENTRARGHAHRTGGDFRHERTTERFKSDDATHAPMAGKGNRGLDYTPLFRFLLAQVGRPWDEVHAEAVARLDREEPLGWVVALRADDRKEVVRIGESTYFSGLFVDDDGCLRVVAPHVTVETLTPSCACCTHTLNGVRFVRSF